MGFVTSPWQFLILRTIQGCLSGTVSAATVLTAAISPPAQVAFTLGLLTTGIAVGNSLGPLVGGVLSDFFGRRFAFFCTGIILVLAGFIALKFIQDDRRPLAERKAKKIKLLPDIRPIASSPMLITIMLVSFGVHTSSTVASPMLPLFIKELLLLNSAETAFIGSATGVVMGVGAASMAIAAVLVGKFSLRFGYWKTLIFCLSAGAFFTLPQAFVMNIAQLTVLRALAAFFLGGTGPVINAIIAVTADKNIQGTSYGINSSVGSAGSALGPLLGSMAAMAGGYRAVFIATASLLGFVALKTASRRRKSMSE
jgi:DHA1 family multidrug resistance protein-like MFS transporter